MPASVRIIRVIDDTYTVETEIEADDTKALMDELGKTDWGRRIGQVLAEMLPEVNEKLTIMQAKERFMNDWKDKFESADIQKVDIDEDDEQHEILIVWINRPVSGIPRALEGYKIEVKETPNYVKPPPLKDAVDATDIY